jgi:hypothetical protein
MRKTSLVDAVCFDAQENTFHERSYILGTATCQVLPRVPRSLDVIAMLEELSSLEWSRQRLWIESPKVTSGATRLACRRQNWRSLLTFDSLLINSVQTLHFCPTRDSPIIH